MNYLFHFSFHFYVMKAEKFPIFKFNVVSQNEDSVDINIDGDIVDASTQQIIKDWFGDDTTVSFKSFRDQVNSTDSKVYNIYINSNGGQLVEAMAMHDFIVELRGKGKTVNTFGRGIIASAATYILMAGSNEMSKNSWLMIHNVSGRVAGTVNEVEQYAAQLRKFNDTARDFYATYTGMRKEDITKMMNAETWMTADEAKTKGFIKNILPDATFSNSIKPENWLFQSNAVLNSYNSSTNFQNSSTMDTTKITDAIKNGFATLMTSIGVNTNANDDKVKNALSAFTKSITDAIPTNKANSAEETQEMVDKAVETAITNLSKNEAFKNSITLMAEGAVTAQLKGEFETLTTELVNKLGGVSAPEDKKVVDKKMPKNRFAGKTFFAE